MRFFKRIKRIFSKTYAIIEKNIKMRTRYKLQIFLPYISDFIRILMPIIIFDKLFEFNEKFGPWTPQNYIVFVFIGFNILALSDTISRLPSELNIEKFWKTLSALMIAPFNRFYFLIGNIITDLILLSGVFLTFFIIIFIFVPISFLTILSVIFVYLAISIVFSSIGLIFAAFAISNESIWGMLNVIINLIFWASCITYPYELFPKLIQNIINYNPIYYLIDFLRLIWIENDIFFTISTHFLDFLIFLFSLIIFPTLGVLTFNFVYKKFGISGY